MYKMLWKIWPIPDEDKIYEPDEDKIYEDIYELSS